MAFDYIPLWDKYRELFAELEFDDIGRLVIAMMDYKDGQEPKIDGNERFVWPFVRRDIDNAREAYLETCQRQSANGAKGGRPKKPTASDENQVVSEKTQKTQCFFEKPKKAKDNSNSNNNNNTPNGVCNTRAGRFTPPTLAEVQSYVAERHSAVDPQGFIDFYESKGWMVGKTPMKDWKAACRNAEKWERRSAPAKKQNPNNMVGADFGASNERIRKSSDWLDEFLAGQEGTA